MRGKSEETPHPSVPWAGNGAEHVSRPRWLDTAAADVTPTPFDVAPSRQPSVVAPTFGDRPIGESSAALEKTLQAAMVAAALEPIDDLPRVPEPRRDYEGELAAQAIELEALQSQLTAMATSAERLRRRLLENSEADVVELAVVLAERIVAAELKTNPALIATWAKSALELLIEQSDLIVVVSADVFEAVPRDAWRDANGKPYAPRVDAKLPIGTCDIQSKVSRIDGSAAARVRSVVESLGLTEAR